MHWDSTELDITTVYYSCYGLYLTHYEYWFEQEDMLYWPVQLGALFAIWAAIIGFLSFFHLVHATCFVLDAITLDTIYKSFMVCAMLSILTLIALSVNPCRNFINTPTSQCNKRRTRLESGATSEIAACFLVLWATWQVKGYADKVRNGELPCDEEHQPSLEVTAQNEGEMQPLTKDDDAAAPE
jgi:hypothetical protein